jgi:putative membrane protein
MLVIVLVMVVAIEHLGIMLVEMFGSPRQQSQMFDLPLEYTSQPAARVAFANQGIYNGVLGAGMIISFWLFQGMTLIIVWRLLLALIVVVAIYGGFNSCEEDLGGPAAASSDCLDSDPDLDLLIKGVGMKILTSATPFLVH